MTVTTLYIITIIITTIVFFFSLRSAFDHSFGRQHVWIQDHILVLPHVTDYFPCEHDPRLVGLPLHLCYPCFFRELGRQRSTIELDTPCVKPEQLRELEEVINEKIRANVPVTVQLLSIDDPAVEKVCIWLL